MDYPEITYQTSCKVLADVETHPIPPFTTVWIPIKFKPEPTTDILVISQIGRSDEHQIISRETAMMRCVNETEEVRWIQKNDVIALYNTNTQDAIRQATTLTTWIKMVEIIGLKWI